MTGTTSTFRKALKIFTPPEQITPNEWCERNIVLSRTVSAKPGRWTAWPWQVEPLNCVLDQSIASAVLVWPAQVLGKSSVLNGIIGWSISQSPCAMLFCLPTGDAAELYSKNKLTPVLYDTPVLRQLVHEEVLRMRGKGSGGNAVSLKLFPGGFLVLVGANSSTGIRSHSCKRMFFDEVSAYPITVANSEGDPIAIATKRAETFPDSFQIITSTPTIRGQCRVSLEFEDTNQSKWFVTCPSCRNEFIILWQHIKWDKDTSQKKKVHKIEEAYLECPSCGVHHDDMERQRMAMGGRWVVTNPDITNRAGYWTNAFICCLPAKRGFKNRMHQWADEFLIAHKRGTYFLRSFQMNVLAEPYELDKDPAPNYNILYDRREQYRESMGEIVLPAGVMLLTVGADVQRDRIEAEILGTGFDGETWGIEFRAFYGSTEQPQVYKEFDLWSQKRFRHESGHWMWSACTCIDANYKADSVYRYVRSCRRKVFATIGKRGFAPLGSSWVDRSTSDNDRLWFVKVDGAKESLYSRLRLDEHGPGYQHFPSNDKCRYDEEYFRQLTVEVIRTSPSGQSYFTKPNEESRNEALDCFPADTDVLTIEGWRSVSELSKDVAIATVNLDSDAIEYQMPMELIARWHDGEMIHLKGTRVDILVTPNHRMVTYKKVHETLSPGVRKWNFDVSPEITLAKDLTIHHQLKISGTWAGKSYTEIKIPDSFKDDHWTSRATDSGHRCVSWDKRRKKWCARDRLYGENWTRQFDSKEEAVYAMNKRRADNPLCPCIIEPAKKVDAMDMAEFMGWFVSEGFACAPRGLRRVYICQNEGLKLDNIKSLMDRLPWHWNLETHRGDARKIIVTSKQLFDFVQECGSGCKNKRVPQWIKDASPEIIERFIGTAIAGDGWIQRGSRAYATVSKQLADDMQELFVKLGKGSRIRTVLPETCKIEGQEPCKPSLLQYHIYERLGCRKMSLDGGADGKREFLGKKVPYSGMVYCASVPNGTLICRRSGIVFIAGNCRIYASAAVEILKPKWAEVKASISSKPENDWREKEEGIKAALNMPIPDFRGVEIPEQPDIDLSALRSKLEAAPKWMNIR